jgi:tetratricopeptide (TPR) repeat protein
MSYFTLFYVFLIFYLSNRLLPEKSPLFGFIVALIFAVHPLHTEVVASIKNRDEILSLLFALLAIFLALFPSKKTSLSLVKYMGILVLFMLSFFSKSSSIVISLLLPFLLILYRVKDSLIFSISFFAISSILFYKYSFLELHYLYFYLIFGLVSITLLYIHMNSLWQVIYKKSLNQASNIDELFSESHSKLPTYAFIFIFFLYFFVSLFFESLTYIYIGAFLLLPALFLLLKNNKNFEAALLIFSLGSLLGVYYENSSFITFTFIAFIVLNFEEIKKRPYHYSLIVVISSLLVLSFDTSSGDLLIFVIVYLVSILFRPLLMVVLAFILIMTFTPESFVENLIFACILLPFSLKGYVNFSVLDFLNKSKIWFIVSLFIIMIYHLEKSLHIPNVELQNNEIITSDFNEEIDRPMLYVENPIVENWTLKNRLCFALGTQTFYLQKLIAPTQLSFYYGYDQFPIYTWKDYQIFIYLFVNLFILFVAFYFFWKKKYFLFWSFTFLIFSLILYSNFLTPISGIVGERLAFTASFAWSLIVGFSFLRLSEIKINFTLILLGAMVLFFSVISFQRNTLWENKLSLYSHDIKHLKNSAQANALLADTYMVEASRSTSPVQVDSLSSLAVLHFENAIQIYDKYINWWVDLARVYKIRKDFENANFCFEKAYQIDSSYTPVLIELQGLALLQNNHQKTIEFTKELLIKDPTNINYLLNLSAALYFSKAYAEVIQVNDRILEINKTIPEVYLNKAYAYAQLQKFEDAKKNIEFARQIQPNHGDIPLVLSLIESLN